MSNEPSPHRTFVINADYEVIDRNPLSLIQGQVVKMGAPDAGWPGWIWVAADDGRGSHVPEELCQPAGEGVAVILREFQARDLSVSAGDHVTSLDEVQGWHWCRRADGEEGWLPAYLLKLLEQDEEGNGEGDGDGEEGEGEGDGDDKPAAGDGEP